MNLDYVAYLILFMAWLFLVGPMLGPRDASYKNAVAGTALLTLFITAAILVGSAIVWAAIRLLGVSAP